MTFRTKGNEVRQNKYDYFLFLVGYGSQLEIERTLQGTRF
jgi:hypothetical protein